MFVVRFPRHTVTYMFAVHFSATHDKHMCLSCVLRRRMAKFFSKN
jgi:hypothetical protein